MLNSRNIFRLLLWLIALHSFVVGVCLIFLPLTLFEFFGFAAISEKFFPVQGGVFHIIMAGVYACSAFNPERCRDYIRLTIIAKFTALLFLLLFYLLIDRQLVVLLSGLGDGLMGLLVVLLYRNHLRLANTAT